MKTQVVSALMAVAVASLSANAITVDKNTPLSVKTMRAIVSETSVVELPAKAAEIVTAASEETREKVAVRTVRIFLQNHHSLAPSLVGAIANAAPEVAPAITAEAITLFPESAYSITKAAVAAAPEQAVRIALRAAGANPGHIGQIRAGIDRGIPTLAPEFQRILATIGSGERIETVDLAILTVRVRIGTSSNTTPADLTNIALNVAGDGAPQQVFAGVVQTVVEVPVTDPVTGIITIEKEVVFTIDTGSVEVPEDLTGQQSSQFDLIARVLNTGSGFVKEVVIESYTN
ncbi:MAG: hypothetical protein HOI66_00850 [Verrucomicrobia bacterium]|nr:hypothetical protein [Verrucomicrobiota bacterium]